MTNSKKNKLGLSRGIVKKVALELGLSQHAAYLRIQRGEIEATASAAKYQKAHNKKFHKTHKDYKDACDDKPI